MFMTQITSPIQRKGGVERPRPAPFRLLGVFVGYFVIAFAFHSPGRDVTNRLFGGGDGLIHGLPAMIFSKSLSAWNPLVQLGHYAYSNTQYQSFYPPSLMILALLPNTLGYNLLIVLHYALGGLFFFLYCRTIRLGQYAGLMGGLFFMCCGFMIAQKGHPAIISAAIWFPLLLVFLERYATLRRYADLGWAAAALALSILSGFPQVTTYSLLVAGPYLIYRMSVFGPRPIWKHAGRGLFAMLAICALSCALASLELVSVAESMPHITRQSLTREMFDADALPVYHLLAFVIPNILGGFYGITTYSHNFNVVEVYSYVGVLPIALCALAVRRRWRGSSMVWFWAGTFGGALLLAFAVPIVQSILFHVPVYNLFRAPSRHLFEVDFALCVLAAIGLQELFETSLKRSIAVRHVYQAACFLAILVATTLMVAAALRYLVLLASSNPDLARLDDLRLNPFMTVEHWKQLVLYHIRLSHPTILYPILFTVVAISLLRWATAPRAARYVKPLVAVFFLLDVWAIYKTLYENPQTRHLYDSYSRKEVAILDDLRFDRNHYRVFPVDSQVADLYPLLNMMHGISVVNDYGPVWLKRYKRFGGFLNNGAPAADFLNRPQLLSLISAQYLESKNSMYINLLRSTRAGSDAPVTVLPPSPMTCAALTCADARISDDGITLQSPNGESVAIVQFPVAMKPSAEYVVSFKASAVGGVDHPLIVDLYAYKAGQLIWDDTSRKRLVTPSSTKPLSYVLHINSGATAPPSAVVRLFTQSHSPIVIRGVRIGVQDQASAAAYPEVLRTPDGLSVFKNPHALPRFRFATEAVHARDFDEAYALLTDPGFDPSRQAVVEDLEQAGPLAPGRILGEELHNTFMRWKVETAGRSLFVVGDSWFPGWSAKVDGRETDVKVVDAILRGVVIGEKGEHVVEMRFWPKALTYGPIFTLAGLLAMGWLLWLSHRETLGRAGAAARQGVHADIASAN